ncbi:hypothetical protein HD806DRAFT_390314 [Xylariaceae sp. AK1471]|nr:hypothetical protein HD806DRAFT_390314 [Xylariaceae sp. AK1471]
MGLFYCTLSNCLSQAFFCAHSSNASYAEHLQLLDPSAQLLYSRRAMSLAFGASTGKLRGPFSTLPQKTSCVLNAKTPKPDKTPVWHIKSLCHVMRGWQAVLASFTRINII